jgi:phage protein D
MRVAADACVLELAQHVDMKLDEEISLEFGLGDELKKVFTGNVIELRPTLEGFRVRALGKLNALLNLRASAVYENQTVGSIVRDLLDKAGLTAATIDDGPTLPHFYVDHQQSGYVYAKDLADRLGYELYTTREGEVMFHALGAAAKLDSPGGALGGAAAGAAAGAVAAIAGGGEGRYQYGGQLVRAGARRRVAAWGKYEVSGESPMSAHGDKTSHFLTANGDDYRGQAGDGKPVRVVLDPVARTKDLADRFAAGRLAASSRTAHTLDATLLGRAGVELGDNVSISDVPEKTVDGGGYVQAIRHRFSEDAGFLTNLRIVTEAA